jgi:DNA replication protein DnaC
LILDDFAMREFTAAQADDLYELISDRNDKSVVITANRAASDWYSLFANPVVAELILDRVVNPNAPPPHGRPQLSAQPPAGLPECGSSS